MDYFGVLFMGARIDLTFDLSLSSHTRVVSARISSSLTNRAISDGTSL